MSVGKPSSAMSIVPTTKRMTSMIYRTPLRRGIRMKFRACDGEA
jgi:hypothetical protein